MYDSPAARILRVAGDDIDGGIYTVRATYSSFSDAIAAGNYGDVDDDIMHGHFGVDDGEIVVDEEFVLYYPGGGIERDNAIADMDRLGLRPATMHELLAFGAVYSFVQFGFVIVALATVYTHFGGGFSVASIDACDQRRSLGTELGMMKFESRTRFLAVPKPATA